MNFLDFMSNPWSILLIPGIIILILFCFTLAAKLKDKKQIPLWMEIGFILMITVIGISFSFYVSDQYIKETKSEIIFVTLESVEMNPEERITEVEIWGTNESGYAELKLNGTLKVNKIIGGAS